MQSRQRRLGRVRHRQPARALQQDPVRRHGGDARSADGGSDRTSPRAMGDFGYDLELRPARARARLHASHPGADGSWWGRWGVNYIYGTWSVLSRPARRSARICASPTCGARWPGSRAGRTRTAAGARPATATATHRSPARGPSTPSQTAWALLGLFAGEDALSPEVGARHRLSRARTQQNDGTWDELHFTGTGFPRHFYLRYYMYRNYFPLMALGSFRARAAVRCRATRLHDAHDAPPFACASRLDRIRRGVDAGAGRALPRALPRRRARRRAQRGGAGRAGAAPRARSGVGRR